MKTLTLAAVPYLNALPLYEGLDTLLPELKRIDQTPQQVAKSLRLKKADLGLVPVISLLDPGMSDLIVLPDLGICCRGEVSSVYLASRAPLSQVDEVYLDPESRTSVALLRLMENHIFPKTVRYISALPGYERDIHQNRAGLLIGDRALRYKENFPHRLDLGQAWMEYTNYPFVFAVWAIRREALTERVVDGLKRAAIKGQEHLDEIASRWIESNPHENLSEVMARRYLQEHIIYTIGPEEHAGLKRFLHLAVAHNMINPQREITFYDTSSHHQSGISGKKA